MPSLLIHSTNSGAWCAEAGLGAWVRPGWRPPEAGPGGEGGRGVPEAAWRRRPWSTDPPGQLGSKKGPFPACRLSSASPPKLTRLSPSFSKGPSGWAFVSSQGPERGIHCLKGKQHITAHSPPRPNSSLWSRKWDPPRCHLIWLLSPKFHPPTLCLVISTRSNPVPTSLPSFQVLERVNHLLGNGGP